MINDVQLVMDYSSELRPKVKNEGRKENQISTRENKIV